MELTHYLVLAAILFAIGAATVLLRRNAIIVFMRKERLLTAPPLGFLPYARVPGSLPGAWITGNTTSRVDVSHGASART